MSTALQLRGGTTIEHSSFTGAAREITIDTDKNTVVVHDGALAGGYPLLGESAVGTIVEAYDATTLKQADIGTLVEGVDPNILRVSDIGTSIQAYNPNVLETTDIGNSVQAYDADTLKSDVSATLSAGYPIAVAVITGSAYSLDYATQELAYWDITGNITVSKPSISSQYGEKKILITVDGTSRTISYGTGIYPLPGSPTTLVASKLYELVARTYKTNYTVISLVAVN